MRPKNRTSKISFLIPKMLELKEEKYSADFKAKLVILA
jgi:hypothetical protein